jgi:SAM-dependent methyltransferase
MAPNRQRSSALALHNGAVTTLEDYIAANRANWNDRTRLHQRSAYYDLPGFLAGTTSLGIPETVEVGPVVGKRLLHLQCHMGLDTLSWARLGAQVTGVDIADLAIDTARSLADQLALDARFIRANIYDLPDLLDEQFDIVFASYGVLCWIPDMPTWAGVAARFVTPGGFLYLVDGHPLSHMLTDHGPVLDETACYFYRSAPARCEGHGSYVAETAVFKHPVCYEWQHHLGEIVSSFIDAGLVIDYLHEHPFSTYQRLPQMTQGNDHRWHLPGDPLPMLFSLRATQPT